MRPKFSIRVICICLALGFIARASAAGYEFIALETIFSNPPQNESVHPHAIALSSSSERYSNLPQNYKNALKGEFIYQTQIRVDGKVFYRIALGNYRSERDAITALRKVGLVVPEAWIYKRLIPERQAIGETLAELNQSKKQVLLDKNKKVVEVDPEIKVPEVKIESKTIAPITRLTTTADKTPSEINDELLVTAEEAFLDGNFARVIAQADQVFKGGNLEQVRKALELSGSARERQGKFSEAMALYQALLDTDPPPEMTARIVGRLEGIRTMNEQPRTPLAERDKAPGAASWTYRGALLQYYRDDLIDRSEAGLESVNQAFVTNLDLQARRRSDDETLAFRIDAGLINDLTHDDTDNTVSSAYVSYTTDDYGLVGGRQNNTLNGIFQRFDGISFKDLSRSGFQMTYALGYVVQSAFDSLDSDNPFVGINLSLSPYDSLDTSFYLIQQEISGLTDRQAVGSELQYQADNGYIYAVIDYDTFYRKLNNLLMISSYRYNEKWDFNLTIGRGNSPALSTVNALQGQTATSIEELLLTFSEEQIYQLAEDRTSPANTLYTGAVYKFDDRSWLNLDFNYFSTDSMPASGGVQAFAKTEDLLLSLDYSVIGFFTADDYTSFGVRLSDSTTSEAQSLHLRSRLAGSGGYVYTPRIRIEHRVSDSDGIDQWILNPSFKVKYRASKKLNFEADLGIEYSDLNLPELSKQYAYSLYLGYFYFF